MSQTLHPRVHFDKDDISIKGDTTISIYIHLSIYLLPCIYPFIHVPADGNFGQTLHTEGNLKTNKQTAYHSTEYPL